ncbi:MAG: SDR family NAD(P)-dependent oxidoreductase, partial [Candidatus Marinimicrobia bacterium]|nr:SDR family NAD(P)-dependent oxidoreductase [Candidatus Neomarinimicrobiota bacterium]
MPANGTLHDHLILITGASSGIGAACAEAFAQAGSRLLIMARRKDRLESLAARLAERHGAEVRIMVNDVSAADAVTKAFDSLPPEWQAVDILVNSAGLVQGVATEWETSSDDIDTMIDTNVKGLLTMPRLCVP